MNSVDANANHWRQQDPEMDAMVLGMAELQAQLDDARKALKAKQPRTRTLRFSNGMPAWMNWILWPMLVWVMWDPIRVVLLGGRIH